MSLLTVHEFNTDPEPRLSKSNTFRQHQDNGQRRVQVITEYNAMAGGQTPHSPTAQELPRLALVLLLASSRMEAYTTTYIYLCWCLGVHRYI